MTDKQDPASLSPDEVPTPYGSAAGIESVTLVAAPLLAGGALALTGVVVQQEDSLALGPVPMVWQATAAMGRGDPCGPAGCRPHPDDQAHPAPQRGAGWVHHPRLSPRHPGRQPQVPGGPGRADTSSGRASFARWCRGCPLRRRCTTAKGGRSVHLHRHEDELRAARRQAMTRTFQQSYRRWRPMVERSIAWLVADGCRRVPYHGIQRNDLWWSLRVAAVNLRRLLVLGLARRDGVWVLA
jgi:Transposase DDE domain